MTKLYPLSIVFRLGRLSKNSKTHLFNVFFLLIAVVSTSVAQNHRGICPIIIVTASSAPLECNKITTTVLVTASGGVAPYTGTGTFSQSAGTYTYDVTDANGCVGSTTITISPASADLIKPGISLQVNKIVNGTTGVSSTQTPYLKPYKSGVKYTSIISVGDAAPGGYKMVGIPDGLGAFDNGNGTFTLLMNHEIPNTLGIARTHAGKGAFVSKWVINKSDLSVVSGSDVIQQVYLWDTASLSFTQGSTVSMGRFCSADLPPVSAFYNSATGKGTTQRIYMNGEETGTEGRGFGHIITGADAGKTYELPYLGKFSWENSVANSATGDKTVVVGTDDGTGGQVYVYIGAKTNTGTDIDKAGLNNGKLYGIKVNGFAAETNTSIPAAGTRFDLFEFDNVKNKSGVTLNTESIAAGVTSFLRPEDGAWDPKNPNDFYFATTNGFNNPTRLWRLRFDNVLTPELGGTIEAVLNGTEAGQQMFDNISIDRFGKIMLLEDVGNNAHVGKVWQYDIAKDSLFAIAYHDSTRFLIGGANFLTQDEEASGVIDMSEILGAGYYLLVDQAHYSITGELVEGGQLLAMYNPYVFGNSTAIDTVRIVVPAGTTSTAVNLEMPATADNCSVASVTNNAPSSFPVGTTVVSWMVTDGSGNTATANQVVIVESAPNKKPVVAITSPLNNSTYAAGDSIVLSATASDPDGTVKRVEFYDRGRRFLVDSTSPYGYTYTDDDVAAPDTYLVTARVFDNNGDSTISDTIRVVVTSCSAAQSITAEGYSNISGGMVSDLTSNASFPNNPTVSTTLNSIEYGPGYGDNYGVRLRGYICAPQTGNYFFFIAGDDQAGLWLSKNENPVNKVLIAYNLSPVGFRSWTATPTQKSAPIRLIKGARYYIETLHKQAAGSDHLSVSWTLPDGSLEAPIAGNGLSPFIIPAVTGGKTLGEGLRASQLIKSFTVNVDQNPSNTGFTITTNSFSNETIKLRVIDMQRRTIEQRSGIAANGTLKVGSSLVPGIYFVEVMQGKERKTLKLIKL